MLCSQNMVVNESKLTTATTVQVSCDLRKLMKPSWGKVWLNSLRPLQRSMLTADG